MFFGFMALLFGLFAAVFGLLVALTAMLFLIGIAAAPFLLLLVLIRPQWLMSGVNARRLRMTLLGLILICACVVVALRLTHHDHIGVWHWSIGVPWQNTAPRVPTTAT
jgi:hypothetical protein